MSILTEVKLLVDGVDTIQAKDIMDTQETAINANNTATALSDRVTNLEQQSGGGGGGSQITGLDIYPVGSIYLTVSTSPLNSSPASWLGGTWERLPEGYALWTASSGAGGTISAGLPNITGGFAGVSVGSGFAGSQTGAFASSTSSGSHNTWGSSKAGRATIDFSATNSNSIYGSSTTVQPPAYKVYAWKRIA